MPLKNSRTSAGQGMPLGQAEQTQDLLGGRVFAEAPLRLKG
jgi:hypothetical protein